MSSTQSTTQKSKRVSANEQVPDSPELQLENVPEELKERDQWLLWDTESEKKQPHWRGDFGISWSDPNDWHSFQEAVEAANEVDSWKVGYVTAADSNNYDGGEYGVIDIDRGVLEDGSLKEWVPSIERFEEAETYIEYSPSGTGMHIPFRGSVPDWWRDGQIGEHEGVDVLSNKFCSFTGIRHGNGLIVSDIDIEPWLIEAYKDIHGDHPKEVVETDDGDSLSQDDVLDDEMVEEALDHLDPDCGYNEWRDIAFAIYNYDSGAAGRKLFKEWSKGGSKYDQTAKRQIETIWDDAKEGNAQNNKTITVATLIYKAKREGWEPDFPTGASEIGNPLEVKNGQYTIVKQDSEGNFYHDVVTSYTLELNAILIDPTTEEQNKKFDLTVKPASDVEEEYDVTVSPTVFNEVRSYKSEIQIGGTTTFSGGSEEVNYLRQLVAHQDAPHRLATTKIGLQNGELVTPEGVYTDDDSDPTQRYVDTGNAIDSKWGLDGDLTEYNEETVQKILELLPETRDSERFLPILGWMYASLYTPHIRDWEDEVPLCGVDADTGAGKTSIIGYLTEALGLDGTPLSAQDTKFSLIKHLSATSSIPIWLDEYKPSDMQQYKLDGMQDLLRKTNRGGDETRGNADKTQERYHLTAPVILSGEQAIQGAAEQRRMIRTQLKKSVTESGTETAHAWAELNGGSFENASGVEYYEGYDASEHARAIHQFVLESDIEDFENSWQDAQTIIYELLSDHNIAGINGIELVALTMVKWGISVYRMFSHKVGADPDISDEEIEEALLYIAGQMGEQNRVSHVEEFLSLVSDAARDGGLMRGRDFAVINQGKPDEQLLIRLRSVHQEVTEMVTQKGLTGYDLLNDPNDYRKRISDLEDDTGSFVVDASKYHRDLSRAIALDMERLDETVGDFDDSHFYNAA